jgi:vancomycin permeability regulator SanA
MTGDNSTSHHNEPVAMKKYAEQLGVPATDITMDYAGFNTYDSCYRARAIFGVQEAILVTHGYHLPRAIMTCESLGVKSRGVAAENAGTAGRDFSVNYLVREVVSTDKAFWQIVFKPKPTALGDYEPIP